MSSVPSADSGPIDRWTDALMSHMPALGHKLICGRIRTSCPVLRAYYVDGSTKMAAKCLEYALTVRPL